MKQNIILLACLAVCFGRANAQTQTPDTTLNRTVVVEQEYTPLINDARKVNVLPQVEPIQATKHQVEYDAALNPARNIPAGTVSSYAARETQAQSPAGYIRAGYGNNGNLDVYGNYRFLISPKDQLNLNFSLAGMDGELDLDEEGTRTWDAFSYRTRASIDYLHQFAQLDLDLSGRFGLSNFNLPPKYANTKQKFTSGDFHVGVASTTDEAALQYRAETNFLLYQRQHEADYADVSEAMVRTRADVWGAISEQMQVGVALQMDNRFYKKCPYEDVTSVDLNPYFGYQSDNWKLRLGAHVDAAFGFGKKFQVSPDVEARYTFARHYQLYIQARGGRLQNDFRRLEAFNPYATLVRYPEAMSQLDATYEQVNGAIGFKASPAANLWLHFYGGYQMLKNDLYPLLGETIYSASPYYDPATDAPAILCNQLHQADTRNFYAGAELSYAYKGWLKFGLEATYRNWDTDDENADIFALAYKPEVQVHGYFEVKPLKPLIATVGYRHESRTGVEGMEAPASVANLYAQAAYEVFPCLTVYAQAQNLMNKYYQIYPYVPAQGINFTGGVSFRF